MQKILTPFDTNYVDLMTPAGIGIGVMVYNYNGEVYLSDEGRMLAEMGDKKFCVGNVHNDSYKNLLLSDKFLDPLEYSMTTSVPMCSECSLEPYCGSDPVFHYATQKDFVGIKAMSPFCSQNTQIIRKIILMMENDKEIKKFFTVGLINKMIPLNASNVIFQNFNKDENLILKVTKSSFLPTKIKEFYFNYQFIKFY